MIISRYAGSQKINEESLAEITIDNDCVRNIIKAVEQRIN